MAFFTYCKRFSGLLGITFMSILACEPIETSQNVLSEDQEHVSTQRAVPIPDQYIVVFHENRLSFRKTEDYALDQEAMRKEVSAFFRKHQLAEENILRVYSLSLSAFVAKIDSDKIQSLRLDPKVKFIEQDRKGLLGRPEDRPPFQEEVAETPSTQVVPWGIKRVGGPVHYSGYNSVFVVDTGIDLDHPDLNVNTQKGFDAYHEKKRDWNMDDEHGHGTHVAGIIGALDNSFGVVGVAAGVPVVPVKVFFGPWAEYTYSGLIAGIEHIGVRGIPGDVANLSFGDFDDSRALDEAVLRVSEKRRIYMAIASGNSRLPADSFSPARVNGPYTITVSAIDSRNRLAWFSHYGPPIKYAAPGVSVLSTWKDNRYRTETGTSMAAPHVAGLRVLGDIAVGGYALNYPAPYAPDPIAVRQED
ncbi:S8 family serine peptidase [Algoriphagus sp. CAU 1675]|uniref:S8 family peptidase n=1 Tax=Algoriphagus sp. CAU 1675 TaxID=3032597 RepID=UPI0023DA6E2C|nr:S8 family serine peptidase [Algoriphagus sp. CAU 1675]MDF2158493.1 S8 family serine peptidase [Algoriphagus sp. CAU 1675]